MIDIILTTGIKLIFLTCLNYWKFIFSEGQCSQPERHADVSMDYRQVNNCVSPTMDNQRQQCNHYPVYSNYRRKLQPEGI